MLVEAQKHGVMLQFLSSVKGNIMDNEYLVLEETDIHLPYFLLRKYFTALKENKNFNHV